MPVAGVLDQREPFGRERAQRVRAGADRVGVGERGRVADRPQTDWGRIATPAMFSRLVYWAVGNVSVTVLPEVVSSRWFRPARLMAVFFFM